MYTNFDFLAGLGNMILAILVVLLLIPILKGTLFTVKQQTNVIIERFGKFKRIAAPGLRVKIPIIDKKAGIVDLRIQQLDLKVETKTKDNVFVVVSVSVQYNINPAQVYDAFYKLSDHRTQISSYVYDSLRSTIPSITLDEVFEKKDDIAAVVASTIGEEMTSFGYNIIKTLISDISPDEGVKASMNSINAAQRERVAAQELAEAERIKTVTHARAQSEAQELQGVGIANQRKAIVDGFSESLKGLEAQDIETDKIIQIILFTQYLDALHEMAQNGSNTILLPGGPGGMNDLFEQLRLSVATGNMVGDAARPQPVVRQPQPRPVKPPQAPQAPKN